MGHFIDGKKIANDLYTMLAPFFREHQARLGIVVVGNNPVIESFVKIKAKSAARLGIVMERKDLPETATTEEIIEELQKLAGDCDALIAQLPMPKLVDTNAVLSSIPSTHDVDALNPRHSSERIVEAPVALAVMEILARSDIEVFGKRVVVVGAGMLVGAPSAELLRKADADVTMFTLQEGSIEDLIAADIVVSGAGKPGLIRPEHLKKGVALIDAGTSEQGGKVVGDADPACIDVASIMTPVPGGVGPVAVAMIFCNLKLLMQNHTNIPAPIL